MFDFESMETIEVLSLHARFMRDYTKCVASKIYMAISRRLDPISGAIPGCVRRRHKNSLFCKVCSFVEKIPDLLQLVSGSTTLPSGSPTWRTEIVKHVLIDQRRRWFPVSIPLVGRRRNYVSLCLDLVPPSRKGSMVAHLAGDFPAVLKARLQLCRKVATNRGDFWSINGVRFQVPTGVCARARCVGCIPDSLEHALVSCRHLSQDMIIRDVETCKVLFEGRDVLDPGSWSVDSVSPVMWASLLLGSLVGPFESLNIEVLDFSPSSREMSRRQAEMLTFYKRVLSVSDRYIRTHLL